MAREKLRDIAIAVVLGVIVYGGLAAMVVHFWQHWNDPPPLSPCVHFGEMKDLPGTSAHWYYHCSQAPGRTRGWIWQPTPPKPWMHCTAMLYRGEVIESVSSYPRCED
jgi:hypothetical protein